MQVVILCGGKGTRLRGEKDVIPKPLALVKGKPLILHIINIYRKYGHREFILPLGFGGEYIKDYFYNYKWRNHHFSIDYGKEEVQIFKANEDFKVTFIDTGIGTNTGGRIKKIQSYINDEDFMLTYGDGLSDINLDSLVAFHKEKGKIATVTGVNKISQYGIFSMNENNIATIFDEKTSVMGVVNGGFFVLKKEVFNYIEDIESCSFENSTIKTLTTAGEMAVYMHDGLWIAVDTLKDLQKANEEWQ